MKKITLSFEEAKPLINEGDILLFSGQGWISNLIKSAGETPYSHVAVASWVNGKDGILECVEFREKKGGRSINIEHAINDNPNLIDVYRPIKDFDSITFDLATKNTIDSRKVFNGKKVTRTMRKMTGLPYGWKRIWWMIKYKLLIFRLFKKKTLVCDELSDIIYPVCSTAVAYAFNSNDYDLVKNRSDEWCEPGDIAKSARINYLFTLSP